MRISRGTWRAARLPRPCERRRALDSPCQIRDHRLVWQHHDELATPLATSQRCLGRVCKHLANSGARWQDVAGRASYYPMQHLLGLRWLHLTRALIIQRKKQYIESILHLLRRLQTTKSTRSSENGDIVGAELSTEQLSARKRGRNR